MKTIDYQKLVESQRDRLFESVSERFTPKEAELIRDAYFFAEKAHAPQSRKGGEPYITHPLAVASIVNEELRLGPNPIIASLLHDVVEDTHHTIEEVYQHYGEDVALLVQTVTKKKKERYDTSLQVDNFQQMLNSIHYDIRALLIKLADRLHNMRTLKSMPPLKQLKTAGETDYFYAPLANRLGLYKIKTELENLSLQYRSPHEYEEIKRQINEYASVHAEAAERWLQPIRDLLADNGIEAKVTCDKRSVYSIWRKMQTSNLSFKEVEHIRVVHIVFENQQDSLLSEKDQILHIYSLITRLYIEKPSSVINYLDAPKENAYRSLHCKLMGNEGRWMEVHIQSEEMRRISNYGCLVERETGVENWIAKFRLVLKDIAYRGKDNVFIEDVVTAFYYDDIVVFAPDGRPVTMPKDSTALDFAYEIHTRLGEKAKYAIVNDKLCPLKTTLHRGDRVLIGTDDDAHPEKEWLKFVKTYKANRSIRQYIQKAKQDSPQLPPYVFCRDCRPLPGDEVIGFCEKDGTIHVHKSNCSNAISLSAKYGDIIENVDLKPFEKFKYPVSISIRGVNRDRLLYDLVNEISNRLNLSIESISIASKDEIVESNITLSVHSAAELNKVINDISNMKNIHEVRQVRT